MKLRYYKNGSEIELQYEKDGKWKPAPTIWLHWLQKIKLEEEEKKLKLRYYQTYDKNGVDSEIELQYEEDGEWKPVPTIREREEEKYEKE